MPETHADSDTLLMAAVKTHAEAALTAQSLTSTYVYYKEAPPARQGDTRIVLDIPTTQHNTPDTNRHHAGVAPMVTAHVWSINPDTVDLVAKELRTRVLAQTSGVPDLSLSGMNVLDITLDFDITDDQRREGTATQYSRLLGFRGRLLSTTVIT